MMTLTIIRQVMRNGKMEMVMRKDEPTDEKHTFATKFFHSEFEKRMLSALNASFPRGHKVSVFLELSPINYW